ncbi:DNA translocase FtsK [Jannaschia sp. Os4]|uniref:DNA translocase FtsK n=1 Tax=Jannaschia sp. Os4 TaxID=2807617 RepID=UPI001939F736|nr:DNA translocase FtsK [Jannaschia sp. Os4]MBM2575302.1 DNA translocase FtsK [Jannaschia sp. Os4]
MAYQVRSRNPLLDEATQVNIARRGREGVGVLLLFAALLVALMVGTHHPADPSWFASTDMPPRNWLGTLGASISGPLLTIVGVGAWGLVIGTAAWGVRFVTHRGSDRAVARGLLVPAWALAISAFASCLVPGDGWPHDFGLGGLFGETVVGAVLTAMPTPAALTLKLLTFVLLGLAGWTGFLALGLDREDARRIGLMALAGLGLALAGIGALGSGAAKGAGRGALLAARALAEAAPAIEDAPARGPLSWLRKGEAAPTAAPQGYVPDPEAAPEDRVRGRIEHAIRARVAKAEPEAPRVEPSLTAATAGRGGPAPLIVPPAPAIEDGAATMFRAPAPVDEPLVEETDEADTPVPAAPAPRVAAKPATAKPAPAAATTDEYELPSLDLLSDPSGIVRHVLSDAELEANARALEEVLRDYGVKGEIVQVRPGPVVTMYELEPAAGVKASRVIGLADDIARSMSALSARVSTVPGRSVIGIELPNEKREMVALRELLVTEDYDDPKMSLPLALGKDIGGTPVIANLAKMPHLLIAGTTGSGKSVAINTMILSLLYRLTPEQCRLIMIDPKMLELSVYDGIPHLLSPVVTDPKKAVVALKWVVGEMEERYRRMSRMGVRNIDGYNARVEETLAKGEVFSRTVQTGFDEETGDPVFETTEEVPERLPYIVVVVDEMADLMMVAGKEIEACIQRLAQMARASGIHLVMATQRPSVDVITGTVKANFPTRISFHVTSKIDSRTILGEMGAEQLLGMGDMLYMAGGSKITRVHGPFCSDEEVEEIVNHLKSFGPPEYASSVLDGPDEEAASDIDAVLGLGGNTGAEDSLYDQAVQIVARDRKCSTSYIQRKLGIGYNKAARLVEQMEDNGVVGASNQVGKREILVPEVQ